MKELPVQFRGDPWRILLAFDPNCRSPAGRGIKRAISGGTRTHLRIADERFKRHLKRLEEEELWLSNWTTTGEVAEKTGGPAEKRAAELIAEEATLRQLREARERSQVAVAKTAHQAGGGLQAGTPRRYVPQHAAELH